MAKIQSRMVAAWALMHFVLYAALATHDYFAHPYLGFRKRILIGPLLQLALALAFALGVARARVALIVVSVITTYLLVWIGFESEGFEIVGFYYVAPRASSLWKLLVCVDFAGFLYCLDVLLFSAARQGRIASR